MVLPSLLLLLLLPLHSNSIPTPPSQPLSIELFNPETGKPIDPSDFQIDGNGQMPQLYDAETGEPVDPELLKQHQKEQQQQQEESRKKQLDFSAITMTSTYTLLDGQKLPVMGLGLYGLDPGDETYFTVRSALAHGYRLFDDTPHSLHTRKDIGAAFRDSGIPRHQIWLASKIGLNGRTYNQTLKDITFITKSLGVEYIDLCLLESPKGGKLVERWDALNEARQQGLCDSIGVSNFDIPHLQALVDHERLLPVINQIEMHPFIFSKRKNLLEFCTKNGILIQAYGSLFGGHEDLMTDHQVVNNAALKYHKTPAQILLRWGFQMGFHIIPKTSKEERMVENTNIFDFQLTDKEMEEMNQMKGTLQNYWNPFTVEVDVGDVSHGKPLAEKKKTEQQQQQQQQKKKQKQKKQKQKQKKQKQRTGGRAAA
jgi:diketogulonate reductase-like aldo/keto reductase